MSKAVSLALGATGISFGNEWIQTNKPNFKVLVAGLASALLLDGVERINPQIGAGLATILVITVLITPFDGKAPVQTLSGLINEGKISK